MELSVTKKPYTFTGKRLQFESCKEHSSRKVSDNPSMQTPLRQFKGIPTEVLARMEKKDLAWERYYDLSAQELGELIRVPKLGKSLHRFVHQFPRLELAAHVQPITRTVIKVGPPDQSAWLR